MKLNVLDFCGLCALTNLPIVAYLFLQNISCCAVIMCNIVSWQTVYQLMKACATKALIWNCLMVYVGYCMEEQPYSWCPWCWRGVVPLSVSLSQFALDYVYKCHMSACDQCWIGTHFSLTFVPTPTCMHDPSWMHWLFDDLPSVKSKLSYCSSSPPLSSSSTFWGTCLWCCHISPSSSNTFNARHSRSVWDMLYSRCNTTTFIYFLWLQTSLKLSTTSWMQNGGTLVPIYVWSTKSWTSLTELIVVDQKTVCWNCWTGGPPKRTERGPFLAHGRL